MNNKQFFLLFFYIINIILQPVFTQCKTLSFMDVKEYGTQGVAISPSFLKMIVDLFHVDAFVETGTYLGDSTYNALPFFKTIHTIELGEELFTMAEKRFAEHEHVHVHLADSAELLPTLLPSLQGKVLLWLDAHYSGGITAGEEKDPLVDEILAIKKSGITNAVILIDDIRGWGNHLYRITDAVLSIRNDYQFAIFGDIAVAFVPEEAITLSPVVQAMTTSRLYQENSEFYNAIVSAEKIIGQTTTSERDAIMHIPFKGYYSLWRGLIYLHEKKFDAAKNEFVTAQKTGCNYPRVQTYANTAHKEKFAIRSLNNNFIVVHR